MNTAIGAPSQPLPQYVMLAFDGSKSHNMWNKTLDFSKRMKRDKNLNIKFTYFISGVYFLTRGKRKLYDPPKHRAGASAIGFAKTKESIGQRVNYLNEALMDGHEIASHANGHFDGSSWSQSDWESEFNYFEDLLFNFDVNNEINNVSLDLDKSQIIGFRAPLLGVSRGLWPALKQFGFRYDTSKVRGEVYWPEIYPASGAWNFPLASFKIAGTGKRTLSMDYNFYVAQSKAKKERDPSKLRRFQSQMYETYINYFKKNYNGKRAPIHIGHHFSLWNNGIYWRAMKDFAVAVCGLPQVRCATYKELADYMDNHGQEHLNANKSNAPSYPLPKALPKLTRKPEFSRPLEISASMKSRGDEVYAVLSGQDKAWLQDKVRYQWEVNDTIVSLKQRIKLSKIDLLKQSPRAILALSVKKGGHEILRVTKRVVRNMLMNIGSKAYTHFTLSNDTLEDQMLKGDHVGAHMHEGEFDVVQDFLEQDEAFTIDI
ncbi:MAG: hypothetical protein ISR65_11385 [Bacteriovoracaceae bacterium]|nr:hypothetical protein [Bacteriovoracaceae bacterium]